MHKGTRWKRVETGRPGASARAEYSNQDSAISKDKSSCQEDEQGEMTGKYGAAIRERKSSEIVADTGHHAGAWRKSWR
jgi:hypothetical protein